MGVVLILVDRRTDDRTDMTKLTGDIRDYANAPIKTAVNFLVLVTSVSVTFCFLNRGDLQESET